MIFNLSGLHSVFVQAINRHEATIVFPLINGRGRFVFLLFIPTEIDGRIKWDDLELFVILGRTQRVLSFDVKGNHYYKGVFKIATTWSDEQAFRAELGIEAAVRGKFTLHGLLGALNAAIPPTLRLEDTIACMQNNRALIRSHCGRHVVEAERVYLLRAQPVPPPKKPREETLRKLYTLSQDKQAIAKLVSRLKERNWTVAWTDIEPEGDKFLSVWQQAFN